MATPSCARPTEMNWLRLYVDTPRDLKIRREPLATRWAWIALLTLARRSPSPPALLLSKGVPVTVEDVADEANIAVVAAERAMRTFGERAMVHSQDGVWIVTNWTKRQPNSDDAAARQRDSRGGRSRDGRADQPRDTDVTVTTSSRDGHVLDTDTDTEEETETDGVADATPVPDARERALAFAVPKPGIAPGSPQGVLSRALAAALGCEEPATPSERRKWFPAIAEMLHAGVTADEIPRLVAAFEERNTVPCTPQGIVNQLAQLRAPRPATTRAAPHGRRVIADPITEAKARIEARHADQTTQRALA